MLFNSVEFGFFLPIIFFLYWFVFNKHIRIQNCLLLVASYFFYGWWDWRFLSLIIFSSFVDFFIGLKLDKETKDKKRKFLLLVSLVVNLGFLGVFKYYNFFLNSFVDAFSFFGHPLSIHGLNIILPVGISFYTFQTLSYTIDIYRNQLKPTTDIISFFAFVSFFPQLVAGPIERASNLLPQFFHKREIDFSQASIGGQQILWGLFKKIVIADRLAIFVDLVYANPSDFTGFQLFIATLFFTFQIYCDFSGYSDIAIGTAKLFGFDLMKNFNTPYLAKSLTDFWRRWHISLSTWFRDYVYIPLGGNRVSKMNWYRNILITFMVSGLWHGANWTYLVWGTIHGLILILERVIIIPTKSKLFLFIKAIFIFLVVAFAWIFFRSDTISTAFLICYKILFSFLENLSIQSLVLDKGLNVFELALSFVLILSLMISEFLWQNYLSINNRIHQKQYKILRWGFNLFLVFMIILFNVDQGSQNFIYFQF